MRKQARVFSAPNLDALLMDVGCCEISEIRRMEGYAPPLLARARAGHTYVAYVLVDTSAAVAANGGAGSDFGPYDGDPGEVVYYSIEIDF